MRYVLSRLREPSTLVGLGVLATLMGLRPELVDPITQAIGGVAAAAAVLMPEGK